MSVREVIDRSPMTRFQVMVVSLCFIMNIVEGFDIFVMAFAASGVAEEWQLTGSQLGLLLSGGLFGMALGSVFLAPLADRIGRRPLTLVGLAVAGVGMLASPASNGVATLGLCRVVTGIGVGAVMASLPVIIAEYSNKRGRGTSTAYFAVGLPLGGVVGGAVAALVTAEYGWRATFLLGAALSVVTLLVMVMLLPESLDYLIHKRPRRALERVNVLLIRMRQEPLAELPVLEPSERKPAGAILRGRAGARSVLLWLAFFSLFGGLYFSSSWTPRLLEQSGLSAQEGISGGILLNLGGIVGTVLIIGLALRVSSYALAVTTFAGAGIAFIAMTLSLGSLSASMTVAVFIGLLINATGASMYAIAPTLYPPGVRTTAVGWAIGVGRIGAIVAPIVAGLLIDAGWTPSALFLFFAVPFFLAAVAMAVVRKLVLGPRAATASARQDWADSKAAS